MWYGHTSFSFLYKSTVFATRVPMLHCRRYRLAHVALSSLQACAGCTVFVTRVPMSHCLRYTLAHVALFSLHACACCAFKLNPRVVPLDVFRYFAALNTEKCSHHLCLKILSLDVQTYFVFLLRGYFSLYTQFSGQQSKCFDKHVLSLSF